MDMDIREWTIRCAARLQAQWPRLQQMCDEVATSLWNEPRWQQMEPEVAVVEWLQQAIPVRGRSHAQ